MKSTNIKSHGRTGEGVSAPVFAGGGEGGSHGIDLSDGAMTRIRKPTNRSAWPLKFLPKPLECCHVVHSAGHPPPDQTAERELQSEDEEGELGEGHLCLPSFPKGDQGNRQARNTGEERRGSTNDGSDEGQPQAHDDGGPPKFQKPPHAAALPVSRARATIGDRNEAFTSPRVDSSTFIAKSGGQSVESLN